MLLFDLDDTLVNSTAAYASGLLAAGIEHGDQVYKSSKAQVKEAIGSRHVSSHNRILYFKYFLDQQNFSASRLLKMMALYEQELESHLQQQWQSLNRRELMLELKNKHRLGIVTNETTRTQAIKLRAIDPNAELFDFMVTSEEVGAEKPDQKIFKRALSLSGVSAEHCSMIGDSLENDILPGQALGMRTFFTCEFVALPLAGLSPQTQTIKTLDALLGLV